MRLREFRVWLAGGPDLAARFSTVCTVERVEGDQLPPGPPAHCLLVESGWLRSAGPERARSLLRSCGAIGVGRVLWIKEDDPDPELLELAAGFDRVFADERAHLTALLDAGLGGSSLLLEATALDPAAALESSDSRREIDVVWLGGWRDEWTAAWRRRLSEVLLAAVPLGLRIYAPDPTALPPALRDCAVAAGDLGPREIFGNAKVAIAASPAVGSEGAVPAALFDAIACDAAVVSPHGEGLLVAGIWTVEPNRGPVLDLVPAVADQAGARTEIERLLSDPAAREATVERCRPLVVNNHTYAHRAATLASAVRVRVIPEGAR